MPWYSAAPSEQGGRLAISILKVMVNTAMSTYLLTLMMPDPVTKGLAAVLTVYLVAYLGLGPVWSMVKAGWWLLEESGRATTLEDLKRAGQRFGRAMGDNGMHVFLLLATAAIGGQSSFVGRGPRLPGFRQAALASPARTRGSLEAAGQVRTVVLGARELVVGLAPTAVASSAMGPGGGLPPGQNLQTNDSHDAPPPQALLDSQAKHIQKELAGQRLPKPDGGYWDHRREMLRPLRSGVLRISVFVLLPDCYRPKRKRAFKRTSATWRWIGSGCARWPVESQFEPSAAMRERG